MTAPFESLSDRRVFVSDFGQDVLFNGAIFGIRKVRGIFDNEYESFAGESLEYATQVPRLACVSDDVRGIQTGDSVTIDGSVYKVRVIMPNGTGMTEFMLEVQ